MTLFSRLFSRTTRSSSRRASRSTAIAARGRNCRTDAGVSGRAGDARVCERRRLPRRLESASRGHGRLQRRWEARPGLCHRPDRRQSDRAAWRRRRELRRRAGVRHGLPRNHFDRGRRFRRRRKLDMVLALWDGFSILMGNGDGAFQPAVTTPAGSWGLSSLAVGDFNNDSNLDLVVAVYDADFAGRSRCAGATVRAALRKRRT